MDTTAIDIASVSLTHTCQSSSIGSSHAPDSYHHHSHHERHHGHHHGGHYHAHHHDGHHHHGYHDGHHHHGHHHGHHHHHHGHQHHHDHDHHHDNHDGDEAHAHHHHHHHHGHHHHHMDPSIWKELPEKILNNVLARLPLPVLLNLRVVSRAWNSKILSPAIASLRTTLLGPARPGFIRVSAHSSEGGYLQLDYLDRRFHWRKICLGVPVGSVDIEAAHAHLLCLSMTFPTPDGFAFKRFLICNPVTAACKNLPRTLATAYPIIVGMTVDRASGDYVLVFGGNFCVAGGRHVASRTAEAYTSAGAGWQRVPDMPAHVTPVLTSVACHGSIYWLAWDDHERFGLLRFDTRRMDWAWILTTSDVDCHVPWGLMERHGVLFKIGKVSFSNLSKAYLWELSQEDMTWSIISEVPSDSENHCPSCVRHCVGHDGALCADNSCGSGGLVYKFDEEGQISLYKTPACLLREEEERQLAEQLAQQSLQEVSIAPISSTNIEESQFSKEPQFIPIKKGLKDDKHNLKPIHEVEEEDQEEDGNDDASSYSSSYSSSSYSSYSDSESSTEEEEEEELEPDLPSSSPKTLKPYQCSHDMVAPFGHLYVFEPCLGKV